MVTCIQGNGSAGMLQTNRRPGTLNTRNATITRRRVISDVSSTVFFIYIRSLLLTKAGGGWPFVGRRLVYRYVHVRFLGFILTTIFAHKTPSTAANEPIAGKCNVYRT